VHDVLLTSSAVKWLFGSKYNIISDHDIITLHALWLISIYSVIEEKGRKQSATVVAVDRADPNISPGIGIEENNDVYQNLMILFWSYSDFCGVFRDQSQG
jgi:hypothetical protein